MRTRHANYTHPMRDRLPNARRWHRCLVLTLVATACNGGTPSYRAVKPRSMAAYPHATDHLIALVREQLTAADPAAIEQQVICETVRLEHALGGEEALLRIRGALDTAYRTRADSDALQRLPDKLADQEYGSDADVCDSLIAAWDSAFPIRADSGHAPHGVAPP